MGNLQGAISTFGGSQFYAGNGDVFVTTIWYTPTSPPNNPSNGLGSIPIIYYVIGTGVAGAAVILVGTGLRHRFRRKPSQHALLDN